MSKYIDLKEQVVDDSGTISPHVKIGVEEALDWLDDHPDQTPARTITRTEFNRAFTEWFDERDKARIVGIIERLFGITVTPDPKPTNADKLEALLEGGDINAQWGLRGGGVMFARELAHALDEAGVKAPGVER